MSVNRESSKGKNVVVTGASRGLGRALSVVLAEAGANVVMVARHEDALSDAAHAITEAAPAGAVHTLALDVADPGAPARIAGAAAAMVGPIDVLVHNASSLGPVPLRPLAETSDEDFDRALAVNLTAAFRLTRAVVGSMISRGAGVVVHVSSDAAVEAYPTWGAYGASKAALDHLTRTWATELEGTGVRVIAIDPGEMDTAMHADAIPDADPATLERPEVVAARIARVILNEALAPSGTRLTGVRLATVADAVGSEPAIDAAAPR
jgi:NAD(P)-dependent dehydrogenase (short-subunit alcohol dehydrogenase family)